MVQTRGIDEAMIRPETSFGGSRKVEVGVMFVGAAMGAVMIVFFGALFLYGMVQGDAGAAGLSLFVVFLGLIVTAITAIPAYVKMAGIEFMGFDDGYYSGTRAPGDLLRKSVKVRPWSDVKAVYVERSQMGVAFVANLVISDTSGKIARVRNASNVLEMMQFLHGKVPDKVDHTVLEYLDTPQFREHPDPTGNLSKALRKNHVQIIVVAAIVAALPIFLALGINGSIGAMVALFIMEVLFLLFAAFIVRVGASQYDQMIFFRAEPQRDGSFSLPGNVFSKLFLRQKGRIGADQVLSIERSLMPMFLCDLSTVKASDGRKYLADPALFKWAKGNRNYRVQGSTAMNMRGREGGPLKIAPVSGRKVGLILGLIFSALVLSSSIGTLLDTGAGMDVVLQGMQAVLFILIVVAIVAMVVLYPLTTSKVKKLNNNYVSVDGNKVHIRRWDGQDVFLERKDLVRAEERRSWMYNCSRLHTTKGTFEFPFSRYAELKDMVDGKAPGRPEPKKEAPGVISAPPKAEEKAPAVEGKGALIAVEDERTFKRRSHGIKRIGLITAVVGFALGIFGAPVFSFLISPVIWFLLWGGILGSVGVLFAYVGAKMRPMEFYENGVEVLIPFKNIKVIYPYGKYSTIVEGRNILDGAFYKMVPMSKDVAPVMISKTIPDVEDLVSRIRHKVGRSEFSIVKEAGTAEPMEMRTRVMSSVGLWLMIGGLSILAVFSFILGMSSGRTMSGNAVVNGLLAASGSVVMGSVMFYIFIVRRHNLHLKQNEGHLKRFSVTFGSIAAAGLLLMAAFAAVGFLTYVPGYELNRTTDLGAFQALDGAYNDTTLSLSGAYKVTSEASFFNCTVNFGYEGDRCGIYVAEGGSLRLENVTLTGPDLATDEAHGLEFEVGGDLIVSNSHIRGLYADPDSTNYEGGLEIYSDDDRTVSIEGSVFTDCATNAILVSKSHARIANCTFRGIEDDAVEGEFSDIVVVGCTFEKCSYPLCLFGSTVEVRDCLFANSTYGIFAEVTDLTVDGCTFRNLVKPAISYSGGSLDLGDNEFSVVPSETEDKVFSQSQLCCFCCVPAVVAAVFIATGAVTALSVVQKRRVAGR